MDDKLHRITKNNDSNTFGAVKLIKSIYLMSA